MQLNWASRAGTRQLVQAMVFIALLVAVVGCGANGEFQTAPVHGRVTYNGDPLQVGSLVFVPVGGGPSAQANIDTRGNYVLGTYTETDGAVIGDHKVMITALIGAGALPEDGGAGLKSVIPEQYSDLENSGLRVTVKPGTKNEINFDLTD